MLVNVEDLSKQDALFFTPGNLPTQIAYRLTQNDVHDAFIVSLLRRNIVLFAASFYFESAYTRLLVDWYPTIWRSQDLRALFFINSEYPSFQEHGLGKIEKSPPSFKPYSNTEFVQRRGLKLDSLGIIGLRRDRSVSGQLVEAWVSSCNSIEKGSIGDIINSKIPEKLSEKARYLLLEVADSNKYDFIWPAISSNILSNNIISPLAFELQNKLADLYSEIMADMIGAIETSPSILQISNSSVTRRTLGDLGLFAGIIKSLGVNITDLRDESKLLRVLALPELEFLRRIHDDLVAAALGVSRVVRDEWRAIGLAENTIAGAQLDHRQIREAIRNALFACGISNPGSLLEKILRVENHYEGRFLAVFREKITEIMKDSVFDQNNQKTGEHYKNYEDILLFISSNPEGDLRVDKEYREIDDAIESLKERKCIQLGKPVFATSVNDVQVRILNTKPTYFHFSGHGDSQGRIVLENGDKGKTVNIRAIVDALVNLSKAKCVVFNSCFSESAIADVGSKIEYAVLMSDEIEDESAIRFARGFYLALGSGTDVLTAFFAGCNSIDLSGLDDVAVPRLYQHGALVKRYT